MPLQVYRVCQFGAVGGRVDVRYPDWGLAAKLPDYYSFAIIAIMLHQYLVECPPIGSHTEEVIVPRRLNPKHIEALITDLDPVSKVDTALKKWLHVYQPPETDKHKEKLSEVITLRAYLFRDCGKIVLKIGSIFSEVVAKKKVEATSKGLDSDTIALTPAERTEALASRSMNLEQELHKIEKKFRDGLIKTSIYDITHPLQPEFLYPPVVQPAQADPKAKAKATPTEPAKPRALPASAFSAAGATDAARSHDQSQEDEVALYTRLQISGLLSKVLLRPGAPIKAFHRVTVDDETPARKRLRTGQPLTDVKMEEGTQAKIERAVQQALSQVGNEVILVEVLVPLAIVKLKKALLPEMSGGGTLQAGAIDLTVSSDDLLPISEETKKPVDIEPALMAEDKALGIANEYPLERHNIPTMKAAANFCLGILFMMSPKVLNEVTVLTMSQKKPYLFQVRSKKAFSKGELLLMPYGELIPKSPSKTTLYAEKNVHEVHLSTLPFFIDVVQSKPGPKAKAKAAQGSQPESTSDGNEQLSPKMEMLMVSPAAMKSFDPADSIPPFWAVTRLSRASNQESNMEIVKYIAQAQYPVMCTPSNIGPSSRDKGNLPKMFCTSAILRNTQKIAIGDVLTLPYEADGEKAVQMGLAAKRAPA